MTNRVVQELTKLAESEPEKFAKVWEHFGAVIKEGLYEDQERRDAFKFARFVTTTRSDGDRTLAPYITALRENQTAIYYLTGDEAKRLAVSPQLEGFRARGVEIACWPTPSTPSGCRAPRASTASRSSRRARARPTSS